MVVNQCLPSMIDLQARLKAVSAGVAGDSLVVEGQSYLRIMGFPIGNFGPNHNGVDGNFGEATRAAISTFQSFMDIPVNGSLEISVITELEQAAIDGSDFRSLAENSFQYGLAIPISKQDTIGQFVNAVYYYAVNDESTSAVPAAVTTAQAILESSYGKRVPIDINSGQYSFNLFGIKGTGPAGTVISWTQEQMSTGIFQPVRARFRAYHSFIESIKDHSQFFHDNKKRYGFAFQTNSVADFVKAIAKAGYATDSNYAKKVINLIHFWGLS